MPANPRIRVVVVGLGPIGQEVAKAAAGRPFEMIGAADPAPDYAGRKFSEIVSGAPDLAVDPSAAALYSRTAAGRTKQDVVLLCTGSRIRSVAAQIEEAIEAGFHVVSTCEELSYPEWHDTAIARSIDEKAKRRGVGVVGTGVNPGLVMDRLPLLAAGACVSVESVRVTRVVDAAKRRGPLRAKVGAGLTKEQFESGVAAKKLGHVGLSESAAMIARGLGWPADQVRETIEPVLAERETDGIPAGGVLGLHQLATVTVDGREKILLDLTMAVGVHDPADSIEIDGDPPLRIRAAGGFHGDRATVGTVVNAVPFVAAGPPGLHKVVTLPLFGFVPLPAAGAL